MTTATQNVQDTLINLLEVCRDGELGYEAAASALGDEESLLKGELRQYSYQRREFGADIRLELERLGEIDPPDHGTISGSLHRGWMSVKQSVFRSGLAEILAECERGEDAAMEAYRHAVESVVIGSISDLLKIQMQAMSHVHSRIKELRDAAAAATH